MRAPGTSASFGMIFKYAFRPQAIIGGSFGVALRLLSRRGVTKRDFSRTAGMGSTPRSLLKYVKIPIRNFQL